MINNDRVVSVTKVDLISLYGLILKQNSSYSDLAVLEANSIDGDFIVVDGTDPLIANQPLKTCDIDATESSVSAATIFFVPAYGFEGFSIDGAAVEVSGDEIVKDATTLYSATLADGAITIAKISF